jgi:ketosteroid isomerase-like protein
MHMNLKSVFRAAALVTLSCSCAAVAGDALRDEIDRGNQAFVAAIMNGDVEQAVAGYTETACVIAPLAENACGREQILAFWTGVLDSGIGDVRITTGEVGSSGDLAYATGTLEVTDADGVTHASRYVLVFRKVAGEWKLHLDSWTPS